MTLPGSNPMVRVLQVYLLLELVVFGLVIPGMIQVSDRSLTVSLLAGGSAMVLALVAAAMIRRGSVGFLLGWLVQLVGLVLGLLTPFQYVTGGVFAVLWVVTFVLGKRLEPTP